MCFANLCIFPKAQSGKFYDLELMIETEFLAQNGSSPV
jgi:hypothetical protein